MADPLNPSPNTQPPVPQKPEKPFNPLSAVPDSPVQPPPQPPVVPPAPVAATPVHTAPPAVPPLPPQPSSLPPVNLPPPPTSPPSQSRPPLPVQRSPFRFIIPILILGIVVLLVVLLGRNLFGSFFNRANNADGAPSDITTITYWGLWEPTAVMREVLNEFETQNPTIKVDYQQQSIKDYRERLQNALANDQGPDVFRYHMTWTPLLTNDVTAIPGSVMSENDFEAQQYPVAQSWLKTSKGYVGLPLMYEGLGLYYNQAVFEAAGKTPPKTWEELRRLAVELTVRNREGEIQRAGVALGSTTNVDNWSDILGLMLLQNAANPARPNNQLGQDALTFFTLFTKTDRVWSEALPTSTVAFANEKVAMILAPSWRAHEIKDMNPNLKFGIAAVPQLPDTQVSWASFWAEGVSSHSDKASQEAGWKLLAYMNQKEVLREFFAAASKQRLFGEIFARTDMADQLQTDPMLAAFVTQAPYAKSWYVNSRTFDNGPNDKIIKYYEDGLNSMQSGMTADKVLGTVEQGITQVISQYRLPVIQ